jgi:hypothetical protein
MSTKGYNLLKSEIVTASLNKQINGIPISTSNEVFVDYVSKNVASYLYFLKFEFTESSC